MKKVTQKEPLMPQDEHSTTSSGDELQSTNKELAVFDAFKTVGKSSALPILQFMFQPFIQIANTFVLGHNENSIQLLAAYGLGNMMVVVTMMSMNLGLSNSLPTYVSQAYGTRDYALCGIYRNRQIVINFITITLTALLLLFCKPLFLAIGQTDEVATLAQMYILVQIPAQYFFALWYCNQWFCFGVKEFSFPFLAQIAAVTSYLTILLAMTSILENILLAVAIANASSYFFASMTIIIGIKSKDCFALTDQPFFTSESFKNIWPQTKFTFQALLMTMWNQWANQAFAFISTLYGEAFLAAQTVLMSLMSYFLMIPMGIQAQTYVSLSLGKDNVQEAKTYSKATMLMALCWGSFIICLLFFFETQFLNILTSNTEIQEIIKMVYPFFLITSFSQSIYGVAMNIIKGMGKQGFASMLTFTSNWIIGIPLSALAAVLHWSFSAFWIGQATASITKTISFYLVIAFIDWQEIVEEFKERRNLENQA